MKKSLYSRTAVGPVRVTWGGTLAAVMLVALALPVAAATISVESDAVLEGHDLKVKFRNNSQINHLVRYKYKTKNGTATSGYDYESASGRVVWSRATWDSNTIVIKTKPDQLCEYDETIKIVLSELEWSTTGADWNNYCNELNIRRWPCNVERTVKIKEDPNDCQAGTFGE